MKYINHKPYCGGVTLLELMIVVAIIGIIAAVAYPSYLEFVNSSRRADAQAALMSFAGAMERHFTINDSYCGAATTTVGTCANATGAPTIFPTESPLDGTDKYYDLAVSSATASTFVLIATPKGAQSSDSCGTMSVDATGARTSQGTDCWQ
ncbi:type IV pilin protein [Motiliproteus sp. MSK22-1]|uniref:type IV pilin protein n=1 Tax=Motiliproteus sp. MSK22-1 TaxID=1897630 RepID=UPI0026C9D3F5|nr:type IV pilin protein [Motiliproteus sp. MSK22-1]